MPYRLRLSRSKLTGFWKLPSNLAGCLTYSGCGSSYLSWRNALLISKWAFGLFFVAAIAKRRRLADFSSTYTAVSRWLKCMMGRIMSPRPPRLSADDLFLTVAYVFVVDYQVDGWGWCVVAFYRTFNCFKLIKQFQFLIVFSDQDMLSM